MTAAQCVFIVVVHLSFNVWQREKKPSLPVADSDSSQCEKRERMRESQAANLDGSGSDEDSQSVSEGDHDPPSSEPESPSSSSGPVEPDDIFQCEAEGSVQSSKNYSGPLGPNGQNHVTQHASLLKKT
ncbi:hypothetical protein PGIGA_G00191070 [Pangasianodon gigas]|uniref:Uncharacterized protein n=1 Tax=Pangasianodon gigas TaxID=30993 RepID=A0ACC5WCQ7_PANGG|nr:hypothetical protein [Pangasianodon gigas]